MLSVCVFVCLVPALSPQETSTKEIREAVFRAMRSGFVRHDFKAYQAIWADDARMKGGRKGREGKYQFTLSRMQIDATRKLRFAEKPMGGLALNFSDPSVTIEGKRADLSVKTVTTYPGGKETVREIYRLRKTEEGWKVYENEWWPLEIVQEGEVVFKHGKTEGVDQAVEEARKAGDPRALLVALFRAYRLVEAYELTKRITQSNRAPASDWIVRGRLALVVGLAADGEQSFRKAFALDPKANVPDYAKRPKEQ